ncbi:unnamed protein product [Protopolystoma xenopodis]|uniref:Uncharacterized protein n=1 Tax=Protopolystoma xenopodis TaxID=117903 RepID=A0A448WJD9_9PLAT|nr:unnamed protein product [Protopolystoma xenopodis]
MDLTHCFPGHSDEALDTKSFPFESTEDLDQPPKMSKLNEGMITPILNIEEEDISGSEEHSETILENVFIESFHDVSSCILECSDHPISVNIPHESESWISGPIEQSPQSVEGEMTGREKDIDLCVKIESSSSSSLAPGKSCSSGTNHSGYGKNITLNSHTLLVFTPFKAL